MQYCLQGSADGFLYEIESFTMSKSDKDRTEAFEI